MIYEILKKLKDALDDYQVAAYSASNCKHLDEEAIAFRCKVEDEYRKYLISVIAETISILSKEIVALSPYDKQLTSEPKAVLLPIFSLAVGKYTNSYKFHLGEFGNDGYNYRLARDQIDDTCFEVGMTFYSIEEAILGIKTCIKGNDSDLALTICDGLIHGITNDWDHIDEPGGRPF